MAASSRKRKTNFIQGPMLLMTFRVSSFAWLVLLLIYSSVLQETNFIIPALSVTLTMLDGQVSIKGPDKLDQWVLIWFYIRFAPVINGNHIFHFSDQTSSLFLSAKMLLHALAQFIVLTAPILSSDMIQKAKKDQSKNFFSHKPNPEKKFKSWRKSLFCLCVSLPMGAKQKGAWVLLPVSTQVSIIFIIHALLGAETLIHK